MQVTCSSPSPLCSVCPSPAPWSALADREDGEQQQQEDMQGGSTMSNPRGPWARRATRMSDMGFARRSPTCLLTPAGSRTNGGARSPGTTRSFDCMTRTWLSVCRLPGYYPSCHLKFAIPAAAAAAVPQKRTEHDNV
eukprot:1565191-Pyramimonas_sp.AAC.1